jgi:membrane-associated phospholipid phosphatase
MHRKHSMKRVYGFSLVVLIFLAAHSGIAPCGWAQDKDGNLPDAPSAAARSGESGTESAVGREATWRSLPRDFLHDQKDIWLFPTQLARGRHWIPTLAVVGGTAGLIVADPHIMPYFRTHADNLDDVNDTFDAYIATGMVAAVPASLLATGYIRHDQYQVSTAILAGEAYGDSAVVNLVVKAITRRQRPSDVPPGGDFHNTFFHGGQSPLHGSSFPSGHATGAFSVATVIATRYRKHRWVPWAMYGMATAISLSRITSSAHFPSDVFLGAAMGYTISRYQVLRPR